MFLPPSPNLAAHRLHACVVQLGQQVDETGLQRELRRHGSLSCYSLLEPLELSRWHASSKYLAMRRRYAPGEA